MLVSTAFIGPMYMHYSFSRADIIHLSVGIPPFLIGFISLPFIFKITWQRLVYSLIIFFIFIMSYFSVFINSYYYDKLSNPQNYVKININGDVIWVHITRAKLVDEVRKIGAFIPQDEGLIVIPDGCMVYPILRRKSPLREIFFVEEEKIGRQLEIISELKEKNVNWIIFSNSILSGVDNIRLKNTHNTLWRYLMLNFEIYHYLPMNYYLLHRKS